MRKHGFEGERIWTILRQCTGIYPLVMHVQACMWITSHDHFTFHTMKKLLGSLKGFLGDVTLTLLYGCEHYERPAAFEVSELSSLIWCRHGQEASEASDDFILFLNRPKNNIDWPKSNGIKISTCRKIINLQQILKRINRQVEWIVAILAIQTGSDCHWILSTNQKWCLKCDLPW